MADGLDPGMVNRVDRVWSDEDLPELVDAAEAVERMMASPGWAAVQRLVGFVADELEASLDHGPPREAADYAKAHGRKSSLRAADDAARAIVGRAAARLSEAQQRADAEATIGAGESVPEEATV